MIPLRDGEDRQLMTTIAEDSISIHSSVDGNDWVLHATARILKHARSIKSSSKQTDFIGKTYYSKKNFTNHYKKMDLPTTMISKQFGHLEK